MFDTAWVGKARAGVRVAARRAQMGLRATSGPPAGRVPLGHAHFHAPALHFGFGAVAIASASRDGAQQGRCVRKKGQRAGKKANG